MSRRTVFRLSAHRTKWKILALTLLAAALFVGTCLSGPVSEGRGRNSTGRGSVPAEAAQGPTPVNREAQGVWRAEVEEGKSARSTLSINNRCKAPHKFVVKSEFKGLRFERAGEVLIAPGKSEVVGAVFDAARLSLGVHRGAVFIECLDCKSEPGCGQDRDRLAVELTVIARRDEPAQGRQDNQELARLAEEEQAEHAPQAGKSSEGMADAVARRQRRATRARELYAQNALRTGLDFQRAAQILLRGGNEGENRLGRELAATAVGRDGALRPLQTGPEQDCNSGIPVCQPTYTQSQSYTGIGASQEVGAGTCLGGETNSVWYIFTAQTSGSLTFMINTTFDYDFALYNITNGGCAAVPTSMPIRCNYSGTAGITGLTLPAQPETPALSINAAGNLLMPGVNVTAGQTYALIVNNFTGDLTGYTLTFGGTASIFDASPPGLQSASLDTASCSILITTSEPVRCSSIAADGSDFLLQNAGSAVVTGASGVNCGAFTNQIRLTYRRGDTDSCGSWTVVGKSGADGNTLLDNCGNQLPAGTSVVLQTPPPAVANLSLNGNTFCQTAPIIADGSASVNEANHFWSVVEADANWNVIGTEYSSWFSGPAGTFDIRQFATSKGLKLECNKYYRVKLAVNSCCTPWNETVHLIRISCPPADAGPDKTVCSCCGPQKLQIGSPASPGITYSWSPTTGLDDPTSSNPTIDFSTFNGTSAVFPSVYTVTATDSFGCTATDSVYIRTVCGCRPPAKVSVTRPNICSRTYTLKADCACGEDTTPTYLWIPGGATTQSIEVPAGSGPYTLICRNECGATASQPIVVPPATPLEGGFPSIQCPNVFTPNGDGANDRWTVTDTTQPPGYVPAYNATEYELDVFDRWGKKVATLYGSTSTGFANGSIPGWDGLATQSALYSWWQRTFGGRKNTYAGQPVSDGTYFYIFRMRNCTTGWTDICHGFTTVLR